MANEKQLKFEPKQANPVLDDVKETISGFMDKISRAQAEGLEFVEASPEIIQFYNRKGLNGAQYFIFQGVKVFPTGKAKEILDKEAEQMGQRIHGIQEGVLIGG